VPPAGKVAGRLPAFTVKALFELLSAAISIEDALVFPIDTVRITGVPTVTSPKSIVPGLICSVISLEPGELNALEFEPQPVITMVIESKATLVARNPRASFPRNRVFEWARCDRLVEINPIIPEPKRLRYLDIDITCVLKNQSADGVIPPCQEREYWCEVASDDY
jgi:hypothetical protein